MTFENLGLEERLLKALAAEGYATPTPIQQQAIPIVLEGTDLIGCAQTGTGKTAAFALPILQRLAATSTGKPVLRALVLSPTRELAIQIGENFAAYGKQMPLKFTTIFGGVSQQPQEMAVKRGVDILIATPGRLLDMMQQRIINLDKLEFFVLDEADRMLDMGFINDIRKIVARIPAKRQSLLFSATMPNEIMQLANSMLRQPKMVTVARVSSAVDTVQQSVYYAEKAQKTILLVHLIDEMRIEKAIVFTRTKHGADRLAKQLNRFGIATEAIHGNKSQSARQNALNMFKRGAVTILCASDIAARGIDIDDISHVFNFDIPNDSETYIHRIGRTGRAGNSGYAISFCDSDEYKFLLSIEKLMKKKIDVIPLPVLPAIQPRTIEPRGPAREQANRSNYKPAAKPGKSFKSKGSGHSGGRERTSDSGNANRSANRSDNRNEFRSAPKPNPNGGANANPGSRSANKPNRNRFFKGGGKKG